MRHPLTKRGVECRALAIAPGGFEPMEDDRGPLPERLRRLEALDPLLRALAQSLDVREVFKQVAEVARAALPHDILTVGRFGEGLKTATVYALSYDVSPEPSVSTISDATRAVLERDFAIARDVRDHPSPVHMSVLVWDPESDREIWLDVDSDKTMKKQVIGNGIRSILYASIRVRGEVVAGLFAHNRQPAAYSLEDARIACRIAEYVALALSHERLAEEALRAAEAQERARRLEVRVARLTEELAARGGPHRQIGVSKKWRDVLAHATKVAATETTVLLTGESGTGKEVVARFIHGASPRKDGPFVALNCAALPEQLLESELFGHEKGAFTGALAARPGRIEQAAGGVLFLDEVGEMSPAVQAKFLRVLQEREFQRLGGIAVKKAEARVVAATNRDLKAAIASGAFREDLYYRLHVFEIHLPPLRERPDDIVALLDHFLTELSASVGRPAAGVSVDAKRRMLEYSWPGNVRELRNALERAVILSDGGLITSEHLPIDFGAVPHVAGSSPVASLPAEGIRLDELERALVSQALERAGKNKSRAARLLGLSRAQLYSRLQRHGLESEGGD
jgi:two-component system response regulator AtoC